MNSLDLKERERAVLRELVSLAGQRASQEQRLDGEFRQALAAAAARRDAAAAELEERYRSDCRGAEQQLIASRQQITARFEQDHQRAEQDGIAAVEQLSQQLNQAEKKAEADLAEARWLAQSVYEAGRKRRKQQFDDLQAQLKGRLEAALALRREAAAYLEALGESSIAAQTPADNDVPEVPSQDPASDLQRAIAEAETHLHELRAQSLLRAVHGSGAVALSGLPAVILVPLAGLMAGWTNLAALGAALVVSVVAGLGLVWWLRNLARRQAAERFALLARSVQTAEALSQRCLARATAAYKHQHAEAKAARDAEVLRAVEKHNPIVQSARQRRATELPRLEGEFAARLGGLQERHAADLRACSERHAEESTKRRTRYEQTREADRLAAEQSLAALEAKQRQQLAEFVSDWQRRFSAAKLELTAIRREVEKSCPDWKSRAWYDWHPQAELARSVPFGRLELDLRPLLGEKLVSSPEFAGQNLVLSLPALVGFPHGSSLFVRTQEGGGRHAVELLQVLVMRLLTSVPAGKLRLTVVDPVGLGQNFAAFMHLADYDEQLVSHRIWTEPHQIEQRLGDLTAHMETVIQKYLRSEFATIEDYNEKAGEIAEPFRLLVVTNFPTGFTELAAKRLASIIAAGPRCGVYTLLSADAGMQLPGGLKPADLQQHANLFAARAEGLVWRDPDFEELPLLVDELPPADWCKNVLQIVGAAAVKAKRVEVPFEAIAPQPDRYWTADSRQGVDVPLGRAGATQLQHLRLGQGTAQHVLIAGKTGSGKSTLLHALIVNAALRYSPDELELYLIDFKKGVEFKTYVTHELPHARVVAIESEREFGLSVMQRLDAEMNTRGELFRELGVQDIAGFRNGGGQLPRILLLVDEFQEFFVADDKLSQEASLLLDRLVRQGRAFGIHVHLGSQTLGGAYSLARSTLGQMAIRIALQCSESDANLILSEDNSAARLLSRPGEAIYNDANGLVEGNHPFQVVWLPDERREEYLRRIQELAQRRPSRISRRQIVFEGMQPADLARNNELAELLAGPVPALDPRVPRVWLGEPLAIQAATSVEFQRRSGANLLWLGQNDEAAAGMMIAAVAGLAAQLPGGAAGQGPASGDPASQRPAAEEDLASEDTTSQDPASQRPARGRPATGGPAAAEPCTSRFYLLDGGAIDGPQASAFRRLAKLLGNRVKLADARGAAGVLAELVAELDRRRAESIDTRFPPLFVFVYDLGRFRELRRQEDDFGGFSSFSGRGEGETPKPRPDKQFAELLREGPACGIHLCVWCDTLTNFNRALDRQALKEFDARVLLQMSAADSSLLVDLPAASQLGRRRALLHREDLGSLQKFRPFAVPEDDWLDWFATSLDERPPAEIAGAVRSGETGAAR